MTHARYYEQILDSLSSGVIALDAQGVVLARNPAACDHLGVPESVLRVGVNISQLNLPHPFLDILNESIREQRMLVRKELVITQPDGTRKEIGLSSSALEGDDDYNGAVFLFVDMTERRKLERAAELNRQLAQIGGLTAGVVHELRNPLSVISGMAEIMQRKTAVDDTRRRYADAIVQEARRMEQSIAQFLGFARPFELEPAPCDVADVVARAMTLCSMHAEKKGVQLDSRCEPESIVIMGDCERLAQAVSNIISNAVDELSAGGRVACKAFADGPEVVFEISDNGPGIHIGPGEDLFSPFFTKKTGGTGLGLAICHRIVTAHSGTVAHANLDAGGACFTIRIPREKGAI